MNAADLRALAEQCEQAAGPNRELEREVAFAFDLPDADEFGCEHSWAAMCGTGLRWGDQAQLVAPKFTSSLDAAMTLVPEDAEWGGGSKDTTGRAWAWCARRWQQQGEVMKIANGATPALALTAAALRALADKEPAQ